MRPVVLTACLAALLPGGLAAEGAVQEFACQITTACDPLGACAPGGEVAIRIEPISTEGTINVVAISIGGIDAEALQDGALGAFEWTTQTASHWLIPAGPTSLVWIEQTSGETVRAETRVLTCQGAG